MIKLLLSILLLLTATPALADFQVAAGTISTPTSTGSASVTGLSFQPKVIILYSTAVTSATQGIISGIGVCQSASARWTMGVAQQQGQTNATDLQRTFKSSKCLTVLQTNGGTPTTYLEADLTSMNSDGFTLDWTTVQGSAKTVFYLALGGTDLSVKVGTFNTGTGTGSQSVTGVGFQPDTLMVTNTLSNTTETAVSAFLMMIGLGESASQRAVTSIFSNLNGGTFEQRAAQLTNQIDYRITNAGGTTEVGDLVSLDADGFTINFTTNTAAKIHGYLALDGIYVKTGTFNQATSTGNASVTGVGFTPETVLFMSRSKVTSGTIDQHFGFSFGVGVSSSARGVISMAGKEQATTIAAGSNGSASKIIQLMTANSGSAPTVNADADFVSMDTDGFTVDWTTADATAREVIYWALGEIPPVTANLTMGGTVSVGGTVSF